MGLNTTPSAERVHIGVFGCTNAGKSSLVNAITGQDVSLVSEVHGTTTDAVKKAMELLPLGPVMIIDTPGFDDAGILGKERVKNTKKVLETIDAAILVCDAEKGVSDADNELKEIFKTKKVPFIIAYSKADKLKTEKENKPDEIYVSALTGAGIDALKERLAQIIPEKTNKIEIVNSFVQKGDVVVLVTPIDASAPKGRIILPQQQVIRNLLDIGAYAVVLQPEQLEEAFSKLAVKPRAVITDSQAFGEVSGLVPEDVLLTSFSILFASYKGILDTAAISATRLDTLKDGDRVLISEGCTHHRQCNDIGTVKLPEWIKKYTNKKIEFDFSSGGSFPEDLSQYAMVVHCGGCMVTEREVLSRMEKAYSQNVPFTNYGILIAYINGILKRSVQVFPELYKKI